MTKEQAIKHLKLMQSGARNAIRHAKNDKEISEEERKEDIEIYQDQLEVLNVAVKALEMVEEFERAQIITGGRLNGRTYAYKCGLEDGKRKVLEQPVTQEILSHIETGITATGQRDSYCVGFCNALVWLKSCITHEEPQYFEDVTPTLKMPKGNTIMVGKIEL